MISHPILIVEDDEDDRHFIADAFAAAGNGAQIRFFDCGFDLIEHINILPKEQHPALIILDYNMPKLNGRDILLKIRSHAVHHNVPVVVFSSGFTPRIKKELGELQALSCLQKGADFDELIAQVRFINKLIAENAPVTHHSS